ncbi:MAG: hypothetical protein KME11_04770 [Timaviella obliquedivisa GSE-PSE-MK23-08B]|jgi:hypothetical protein|nr:hypothetical protein [Timaviella obliquedivisa GSE-PSE-MK23-08B]
MSTKAILKSLLEETRDDREVIAKLRSFRREWDEYSAEQWSGAILKAFMEHTAGFEIDYRTFTRWKKVAGISADKQRYGHGSFVLATAIAQLKGEEQKIVLPTDVLGRVEKINPKLGMAVWAREVIANEAAAPDGVRVGETIPGIDLPEKVRRINGISRSEDFYYRNLEGYSRLKRYTLSQVMAIAISVQRYVSSTNNSGNGSYKKATDTRKRTGT